MAEPEGEEVEGEVVEVKAKSLRTGLETAMEVQAWKQRLKSERAVFIKQDLQKIADMGPSLYDRNSYFTYYVGKQKVTKNRFGVDRKQEYAQFDPKDTKDRWNPPRNLRATGHSYIHNLLISQDYGRMKPIDNPKGWGHSNGGTIDQTFFDRSHLH